MLKKVPHTYVIIFSLIVFAALLTHVLPGGEYSRNLVNVNGVEREVVDNQSFHFIESEPQSWQIFSAFFDGFLNTSNIIVLILMIGGAFWIINDSRAIDIGIYSFLNKSHKLEKYKLFKKLGIDNIILLSTMLIFSTFGAVFGMSEETIAFTIIFVPLAVSMGYDSIVGVSLCFVAAALGFAGAMLNPFTVGIAQGLSDIPLFSGIEYRLFSWIVINAAGFTYILIYANKVKKNPQSSVVYENDSYWRKNVSADLFETKKIKPGRAWIVFALTTLVLVLYCIDRLSTTLKIGNSIFTLPALPVLTGLFILTSFLSLRKSVHYFIINMLLFTVGFLITGVMGYGWYILEIATIFMALGLISGVALRKSANEITKLFLDGAKDILPAAMVVGLAGGIIVILKDGHILDTILFYVSEGLSDFGKVGTIIAMYFIQTTLNIFIPSGSGQAALTMPIMSQFADIAGISRQAVVCAFQFGDGFTNMITPTSGILIGVLGIAKIPYDKWFKWAAPFILMLIIIGLLLLIPTVTMNLNGF